MHIKIIGKNSSNRIKLLKNINKVQKELNDFLDIEILEDDKTIKQYQNIPMPIFMINDKIISNGKILTDREIKHFIKNFA